MTDAPDWAWRLASLACVLGGVALVLLSDPLWQRLRNPSENPSSTTVIVGLSAALVAGVTWRLFVAIPTPGVTFSAMASDVQYNPGMVVAGVKWQPRFSTLKVHVHNQSGADMKRMDLEIVPNEPVVAVEQSSGPDASLVRLPETDFGIMVGPPGGDSLTNVPATAYATSGGYRVRCDRLNDGRMIELIMVVGKPSGDYGLVVSRGDTHLWVRTGLGPPHESENLNDYFEPKVVVSEVKIEGNYRAGGRAIEVNETIHPLDLGGFIEEGLSEDPGGGADDG